MAQIILVIIALVIRLAWEGAKESGGGNKKYFHNANRTDLKIKRIQAEEHNFVSDRPTLDQAINKQSSGATTYQKPEVDHFENYDTDDYETFTKDECFEEEGHFVESQIRSYTSYDMRANKIKFMIYALVHCMWEDDDEITRKEKRMFKMISRAVTMNLGERDTEEVRSFIEKRITLEDVVNKQSQYNLDINDVIDTMSSLRKHLKRDKQYDKILEILENRFRFEL